MARVRGQKLKLLYIIDILKKYTDEDHPINANEIVKKLSNYGIEAERKSIYDDILALESYGLDVIKAPSNKGGWFLGDREFETPEIYLLCDAVKNAKFISAKKTRELLSKLNGMLSENQSKKMPSSVYFDPDLKGKNEELYYTIDTISDAISNGKQIKFNYSQRILSDNRQIVKKTKTLTVNPYALTWQDDHYYLVCNHVKYDNLIHLRLDRINKIEILSTDSKHFSEVCEYKDFFDIADYTKKLFSMYGGVERNVELVCEKSIIEQVLDRFGEQIFIKNVTENTFSFSVNLRLSDALVTWIINYGDKITVKKPPELKEMLIERTENILNAYKKEI